MSARSEAARRLSHLRRRCREDDERLEESGCRVWILRVGPRNASSPEIPQAESSSPPRCASRHFSLARGASDLAAAAARPTPLFGPRQVFISGALHGDERVGPTAAVELATLLLGLRAAGDPWAAALVERRSLVVVPAANAVHFNVAAGRKSHR